MQEEVEDLEGTHYRCRSGQPVVIGIQMEVGAQTIGLVIVPRWVQIEAHKIKTAARREPQLEVVGNDLDSAIFFFHLKLKVKPAAVATSKVRKLFLPVEIANGANGNIGIAVTVRPNEEKSLVNRNRRFDDDFLIARFEEVTLDGAVKMLARRMIPCEIQGGVGSSPEPVL